MSVNWGLAGPGINALEILNAAGNAQAQAQRAQAAQQEQAKQAQIARLSGDALNGDERARAQLAYIDRDFFQSLDKESHAKAKADLDTLGQYALLADTPQKWDAYVQQYVQMGHPEAQQYLGKFSPQLRESIIGQANLAKEYMAANEPKWVTPGEGGAFNARDPNSVQGWMQSQNVAAPPRPVGKLTPIGGPTPQASGNFPGPVQGSRRGY